VIDELREQVQNQWRNPQHCFAHRVTQVNTNGSKYFDSLSVADVDAINIQLATDFYKMCFRDPGMPQWRVSAPMLCEVMTTVCWTALN